MYKNIVKRILDLFFSLVGIIILSPIMLLIILVLNLFNNKKVFFVQERPGLNGVIFRVIKFQTMNENTDSDGNLLSDEARLTKLGKFLRATSLDEIPQLFNIIKGDMSIVGPRPLLKKYLPLYSEAHKHRHDVLPGVTGLAQVNGRNNISWEKKLNMDIYYVENISFCLDVKIIFLTIFKLITREGVKKDGHATTDTFNGL